MDMDWRPLTGSAKDVVAVFDAHPVALCAVEGPDHRYVAANAAYRAFVGAEDVIGRPIREVLAVGGQQLVEMLDRVYATGEPVQRSHTRAQFDPDDPATEFFLTGLLAPWRDADGAVRGVVAMMLNTTEEALALRAAADRTAGAEQRLEAARDVVLTLQRNLLPPGLPVLPRLRLAAEYRVAGAELQAGGDWFDAIPLADGRIALVVGDVVGHGAASASAMARLSPVLHQSLAGGADVAAAIDALDAFAGRRAATRAATVCVVLLDPATGAFDYASRAHPAPLVTGLDGTTRFLEGDIGGPLGVGAGPTQVRTATLGEDETLLLYTDGLIERPGVALTEAQATLAEVAASAAAARGRTIPRGVADRLCELIVERLDRTGFTDDVTLVAAHRLAAAVPDLRFEMTATVAAAAVARTRVFDWLIALGVGSRAATNAVLAVYEAAINVAEHAYDAPGTFVLSAGLGLAGGVRVEIADEGQWREQPARAVIGGGRGLGIMRAVSDHLDVDRSGVGTTIRMDFDVEHPAVLHESSSALHPSTLGEFRVQAFEADPPLVRVAGPVDAATAPLLRRAVTGHGDGGTRSVVVDLSEVRGCGHGRGRP